MVQVLIYGAGDFGREVLWLCEMCNAVSPQFRVVGFIDDARSIESHDAFGYKLLSLESASAQLPTAKVVCAVGHPATRAQIVQKAAVFNCQFASIIHPKVEISRSCSIGPGSIICVGVALTTDVQIGQHVHINMNSTIGHNVLIGDFTTIGPGVHVAGRVEIGKRVFIGAGVVITNGTGIRPIIVGDDAYIGAGSCLLRSVPPGSIMFGVPARPVPITKGDHSLQ